MAKYGFSFLRLFAAIPHSEFLSARRPHLDSSTSVIAKRFDALFPR
jgi:hypothetical protein